MKTDAIIVADLGFGDAGKGTTVDWLARNRDVHTVVRYNGGAQAAHNVLTPDGRHHTFSQFGSASFIPDVRTHLSRFVVWNPFNLLAEEEGLRRVGVFDAFNRLSIDQGALIATPFNVSANRLREIARGNSRHGSCGQGVGDTVEDWQAGFALNAADLKDTGQLEKKLRFVQMRKREELQIVCDVLKDEPSAQSEINDLFDDTMPEQIAEIYSWIGKRVFIVKQDYLGKLLREPGTVVFEGAQGVLLDQWYGFWPHTTWSDTTYGGATALLAEQAFSGGVQKLGVLRTYTPRHGAGPLPTEDEELTGTILERHNTTNSWQGAFRAGWTDLPLIRYAVKAAGRPDGLVLTHMDFVTEYAERNRPWPICFAYQNDSQQDVTDLATPLREISHSRMVAKQGKLAAFLMKTTPIYGQPREADHVFLSELISEAAGAPVVLESWGSTATSKRQRVSV